MPAGPAARPRRHDRVRRARARRRGRLEQAQRRAVRPLCDRPRTQPSQAAPEARPRRRAARPRAAGRRPWRRSACRRRRPGGRARDRAAREQRRRPRRQARRRRRSEPGPRRAADARRAASARRPRPPRWPAAVANVVDVDPRRPETRSAGQAVRVVDRGPQALGGVPRADQHAARGGEALARVGQEARVGLDRVLQRAAVDLGGVGTRSSSARARIAGPITRWFASATSGRARSATSRTARTLASR